MSFLKQSPPLSHNSKNSYISPLAMQLYHIPTYYDKYGKDVEAILRAEI